MEGISDCFTIFILLSRYGRNFIAACGYDLSGEVRVFPASDREGFSNSWGVIKSLVDDRLFGKLVFIRGEMEVGEARLLRVLVGKTDKKVHGHSYVSMREDDDPPPMSFHDLAFSMNK